MYLSHSQAIPKLSFGRRAGGLLALSAVVLLTTSMSGAYAQRGVSGPRLIVGDSPLSPNVQAQIAALEAEKDARTPTQRKIDSQLLYAVKMAQHQAIAPGVAALDTNIIPDKQGMILVDINAHNTVVLLKQIAHNGVIVNNFPRLNAIRARVPLTLVPTLAASPDVQSIRPAVRYHLRGPKFSASPEWRAAHAPLFPSPFAPSAFLPSSFLPPALRERRLLRALPGLVTRARESRSAFAALSAADLLAPNLSGSFWASPAALSWNPVMLTGMTTASSLFRARTGSVDSEGDVTHRADLARSVFQVDGTGIKIGVLSDGVASLSTSQSTGDLGPVTVLSGQAGPSDGDEGTAMLEIVHDLAPGASLYFATADTSEASFATNIRSLRAAGCDIIVDDVGYEDESPFQDGPVAQAVNDVTAGGALYFSAAGNGGNKDDNTSSIWEGDFVDGGAATRETSSGTGARLHSFGTLTYNTASIVGGQILDVGLFWTDPLGGSSNDYDLYVLNSNGTNVRSFSNMTQNGTQDPSEFVSVTNGQRLVIVKRAAAAPRYLHLNMFADDGASTLTFNTAGSIVGHPAALNAFAVGATPAVGPYPDTFNSTNVVETFSGDGPRRIFFNADGSAITPGNFSSTGGTLRNKPDITAADGVSTSLNNIDFNPFYGTSAAAPHAAAIAGLLKSYNPALTYPQVQTALESTAIDIMAAGFDRDSGFGIIDAASALNSVPFGALTSVTLASGSVSGGTTVQGTVKLHDPAPAGGVAVTLSTLPAGVASVPASVTVPAGQTSANFPIQTTAVTTDASVNIVARYSGVSRFTTLNVSSLYLISGYVTTLDGTAVSGVTLTAGGIGIATLPTQTLSPNLAIPDGLDDSGSNPGAKVSSSLTVSSTGTIVSVQVGVNITHPYRGDLQITLVHPDGTTVILKNPDPQDAGTDVITSYPDQTAPIQSLSAFAGKPTAGTWHLTAQDFYSGDTGTLNSWSLTLTVNGVPITLTASTGSDGTYSFANQRSGTFTLTPAKAGFDFIPHTLSATIGPNQTGQNFTLSQAGIRVTATAAFVGSAYQVTVTCANNASAGALNAQITRAQLGAAAAPASPALPVTLGTIASGSANSVTLTYPVSAGAHGSKVLLRLSGASSLGSFGGSLQITLP